MIMPSFDVPNRQPQNPSFILEMLQFNINDILDRIPKSTLRIATTNTPIRPPKPMEPTCVLHIPMEPTSTYVRN